jgi:hypothetical protein
MGDQLGNLKSAELSNWSGKAYIGERRHSKLIQTITELSSPGIYFLLTQDESSLQKKLYIGEADEVNNRIKEHFSGKDWWENFVAFISKDANLTKAHVRYLEKRFFQIAKENTTAFSLQNSSEPPGSKLPPSDVDDLEDFLGNMVYVLQNLGIVDFAKTEKTSVGLSETTEIFLLPLTSDRRDGTGSVLKAKLRPTASGYRLLEGSFIEAEERKSFVTHNYYPLRKKLEADGLLLATDYPGILKLKVDVDYTSSSAAASVVKNRATNGPKEWKTDAGQILDEWESNDATSRTILTLPST